MLFNYRMMCHSRDGTEKPKKLAELHLHTSIYALIEGKSVMEEQLKIYANKININKYYIYFIEI